MSVTAAVRVKDSWGDGAEFKLYEDGSLFFTVDAQDTDRPLSLDLDREYAEVLYAPLGP